jgi:hypothetical protein
MASLFEISPALASVETVCSYSTVQSWALLVVLAVVIWTLLPLFTG